MSEVDLASFFRNRGLKTLPPRGYCKSWDDDEWPVLVHQGSGIVLRNLPVRPPGWEERDDGIVLYLYTSVEIFRDTCRSREPWDTLEKRAGNPIGACFGKGVYATSREPTEFASKDHILISMYTNTTDPTDQLVEIGPHQGMADCCIPLLVPQDYAMNTKHETTPEMVRGHGKDITGQDIREDRDVWVVNPPHVVDAIACRFKDVDASIRRNAVMDMVPHAQGGKSGALELILLSVEDPDPTVRSGAVLALSQLVQTGDDSAVGLIKDLCVATGQSTEQAMETADPLLMDGFELRKVSPQKSPSFDQTTISVSTRAPASDPPSSDAGSPHSMGLEWTHTKHTQMQKIFSMLALNLFLLLASIVALSQAIADRGALENLNDLLSLPVGLCSLFAGVSAARYARYLSVQCKTAEEFHRFQQLFKIRVHVEVPTVLAIISASVFTFLLIM